MEIIETSQPPDSSLKSAAHGAATAIVAMIVKNAIKVTTRIASSI